MLWIIKILANNLLFVFVTEMFLAFLLGARSWKKEITVALVNVITNPVVVLYSLSFAMFLPEWETAGLIILEILAVLTEGFIFRKCKTFGAKNPYIVSLLLNALSFSAGEIINKFL